MLRFRWDTMQSDQRNLTWTQSGAGSLCPNEEKVTFKFQYQRTALSLYWCKWCSVWWWMVRWMNCVRCWYWILESCAIPPPAREQRGKPEPPAKPVPPICDRTTLTPPTPFPSLQLEWNQMWEMEWERDLVWTDRAEKWTAPGRGRYVNGCSDIFSCRISNTIFRMIIINRNIHGLIMFRQMNKQNWN